MLSDALFNSKGLIKKTEKQISWEKRGKQTLFINWNQIL